MVTYGSWITLGNTSIPEIMLKDGEFDWLVIDLEHSVIDYQKMQELIQVISSCGVKSYVRITSNNKDMIKRAMDAGANGVIVPMVITLQDAVDAVDAVKYPPKGSRGVGLARAQGYGFNFEEYNKWQDENSEVIIQLEHKDTINNLDLILKYDAINGYIIGPYDLSASMGQPGNFNIIKDIEEKALKIARKYHKIAGYHVIKPDANAVKEKIKGGYNFIGVSLDTMFLGTKCQDVMKEIKHGR